MQTSLIIVIASALLYLLSALLYFASTIFPKARRLAGAGSALLLLGVLIQLYWFVARTVEYWKQYQGFVLPAVSAFEAIAMMAFLIAAVYYIIEHTSKSRAFGGFVMLVPVAAMAYLLVFLPGQAGPRDLPPALKSYWLPTHIGTLIFAYAVFSIAFIISAYYIYRAWRASAKPCAESSAALSRLDSLIYNLTLAGYPFLTLGLFLGAVWANEAWGTYWAWDPKESWALVTWIFYTMYFHARLTPRWRGIRSQALNISAYAVLLTTFIGVNIISEVFGIESIHAYAATQGGLIKIFALFLFIAVPLAYALHPRSEDGKPASSPPDAEGKPCREEGLWDLIVSLMKSLPAAVMMLLVWGILCILGTLIPQRILGAKDSQFIEKFGEAGFSILNSIGLTDVFRAWYFELIFFWLAVAALVCTLSRLRGVRAELSARPGNASALSILSSANVKIINGSKAKIGLGEFTSWLRARRYRVYTAQAGEATVIQADRWALRKYMPVLLHAAILAIFIGGAMGRNWGFNNTVTVLKGETIRESHNPAEEKQGIGAKLASLLGTQEYELELHDFTIEYNKREVPLDVYEDVKGGEAIAEFESYEIRHYISDLELSHNGHKKRGLVVVNHPLRVGATTFYQTSYFQTGNVIVSFNGIESTYSVQPGYVYQVGPEGALWEAEQNFDPGGSDLLAHPEPIGGTFPVKAGPLFYKGKEEGRLGPIGLFRVIPMSGEPPRFELLKPDKPMELDFSGHKVTVRMAPETDDASVFQYKQDPGVWLVFLGWMVLIAALLVTAFGTFVRIEAYWGKDGVVVRARAHGPRTADAFARAVEKTLMGK